MNPANRSFELTENRDGEAAESTVMSFGSESNHCRGIYTGPNVVLGQCLVYERSSGGIVEMVYQAVDREGGLNAGSAIVSFEESREGECLMILEWTWLSGDKSSGISVWRELET
jgi:hypothetical protein